MKKIILILICIQYSLISFGQFKKVDSPMTSGIILTGGGTALAIGGFLTPADVNWVQSSNGMYNQTTNTRGSWVKQPIYAQGPRLYAIAGGVTITITGLITILSKKNR